MQQRYIDSWDSIRTHQVPAWYHDCKLGIFIHWGLYSVPAFAPMTGELGTVEMDERWFCNNPYAEWYFNSINVKKGPSYEYHLKKYGADFKYEDFTSLWKAQQWDPKAWAKLFKEAGAGYVVLTSKHHDGYCLFDSQYTDYSAAVSGPKRDIVGELSDAVRNEGMKMGLYYSGMIDWHFYPVPQYIQSEQIGCPTFEYADYAFKQSKELIDKYHPSVFWNDIGWPYAGEPQLPYLLSYYYNVCQDGVVDDRFNGLHCDFTTKEYQTGKMDRDKKWEMCRGLGLSFGYNAAEDESYVLSAGRLIGLLAETVANNGNLLINIGPKADGTIPEIQVQRLKDLGAWLKINGEAIYGTRCSERTSIVSDSLAVHFTSKDGSLYAIADGKQDGGFSFAVDNVSAAPVPLDARTDYEWQRSGDRVVINIRNYTENDGAVVFKFENQK